MACTKGKRLKNIIIWHSLHLYIIVTYYVVNDGLAPNAAMSLANGSGCYSWTNVHHISWHKWRKWWLLKLAPAGPHIMNVIISNILHWGIAILIHGSSSNEFPFVRFIMSSVTPIIYVLYMCTFACSVYREIHPSNKYMMTTGTTLVSIISSTWKKWNEATNNKNI